MICTCGPDDPPYEEQHREFVVAFVLDGLFEQHGPRGRTLMTPGAAMLGNPGACFECSHTHARGDRCLSFWYSEEYFDRILADASRRGISGFAVDALPPLRETAALSTRAAAAINRPDDDAWDEVAAQVAIASVGLSQRTVQSPAKVSSRAESRVADAVRLIERRTRGSSLARFARQTGWHEPVSLSPGVQRRLRAYSAPVCASRAAETSGCAPARRAGANHRYRARLGLPRRVEFQPRVSRRVRCLTPPVSARALIRNVTRAQTVGSRRPLVRRRCALTGRGALRSRRACRYR